MRDERRPPAGEPGALAKAAVGAANAAESTAPRRQRPCRPWCSLSLPTASWVHLLDDDPALAAPAWRLAWVLHGLPDPVPQCEYRDLFAAFEAAHGLLPLVEGLRKAASIPAAHGSGVDVEHLALLADEYAKRLGRRWSG